MHIFELPFPPSFNHVWKHRVIGKVAHVYISQAGREFRRKVVEVIPSPRVTLKNRLKVIIELFPPTERKFDIDNRIKALNDALTHAEVWVDDEQIDVLTVKRMDKVKGGKSVVYVEEII